jgi:hypothetical protein
MLSSRLQLDLRLLTTITKCWYRVFISLKRKIVIQVINPTPLSSVSNQGTHAPCRMELPEGQNTPGSNTRTFRVLTKRPHNIGLNSEQ